MSLLREKMLTQQLADANEKAVQLEKTARWWSECTVRWREKWGKVKNQRNKLQEEVETLQGRNKALIIEYTKLKENNEILKNHLSNEKETKQIARVQPIIDDHQKQCNIQNHAPLFQPDCT